MRITPVKTYRIRANEKTIFNILDTNLKKLPENSVVAITSKIISLCEGSVVKVGSVDKETLVKQESTYYLPKEVNPFRFNFTITKNTLIASAGIDESNGDGYFTLWPHDPQKSANDICAYLKLKHKKKHIGVIVVDSKSTPLRWGTVGTTIAHSGFIGKNNYIGKKDLFDYKIRFTNAAIAEGLGAAAVLTMGEGSESTPIAIITEIPFVQFTQKNPTKKELSTTYLNLDTDLFAPLLKKVPWKKGKK